MCVCLGVCACVRVCVRVYTRMCVCVLIHISGCGRCVFGGEVPQWEQEVIPQGGVVTTVPREGEGQRSLGALLFL